MRLTPGDPLSLYLYQTNISTLTEEQHHELEVKFGLDKPMPIQYFKWIGGVLHGDLGYSWTTNQSVAEVVKQRVPITLYLGALALIISAILGPLLGVISALRRGTWIDTVISVIANVGITMPVFWLGIVLIWVFAVVLKWLPIYGFVSPFTDFWQSLKTIIMPVFCLSLPPLAGLVRLMRSSALNVTNQDYIRTARSKGLKERNIVTRHILKNAFIPVMTMLGMQLGTIIGSTVLIESVFNIPGMGRALVNGVFSKDYQVVQAGALISAALVVITNIVVDISYGWFDPRIREGD
jgi:peptide/nickel transport system permease protein